MMESISVFDSTIVYLVTKCLPVNCYTYDTKLRSVIYSPDRSGVGMILYRLLRNLLYYGIFMSMIR